MDKLIRTIENFTKNSRMIVLRYLSNNNVQIITNADGSRINLDKLTDEVYSGLIELVASLRPLDVEEKYLIF
jgi:hypothetical protein